MAPHGAGGFEKALGAKPPGGDVLGAHGSGSGPGSVQATQCQKRHIAALNSLFLKKKEKKKKKSISVPTARGLGDGQSPRFASLRVPRGGCAIICRQTATVGP